jgi:hypothetical protein
VTDNINPEVPDQPDQENSILDDLKDIFQDDDDRQNDQADRDFDALFEAEDSVVPAAANATPDEEDFDAILAASNEAEMDSAFDALFAEEEAEATDDNPAGRETVPDSFGIAGSTQDPGIEESFAAEMSKLNESIAADDTGDLDDAESVFEDVFGQADEDESATITTSPAALDPFATDADFDADFDADSDADSEDDFAALFADEIESEPESSASSPEAIASNTGETNDTDQFEDAGDLNEASSEVSMDDAFASLLADSDQSDQEDADLEPMVDVGKTLDPTADTEADFSFRTDTAVSGEPDAELIDDEESSINDAFESILADTNPGIDPDELADFEEAFAEEDDDDFGIELDQSAGSDESATTNLQLDDLDHSDRPDQLEESNIEAAIADFNDPDISAVEAEPESDFESNIDPASLWDSAEPDPIEAELDPGLEFDAEFDAELEDQDDLGQDFASTPAENMPDPFAFDADEPFASEPETPFLASSDVEGPDQSTEPESIADTTLNDPFAGIEVMPDFETDAIEADDYAGTELPSSDEAILGLDNDDLSDDNLGDEAEIDDQDADFDDFEQLAETEEVELANNVADEFEPVELGSESGSLADSADPFELDAEMDQFDQLADFDQADDEEMLDSEIDSGVDLAATVEEGEDLDFSDDDELDGFEQLIETDEQVEPIAEIDEASDEMSIDRETEDQPGLDLGAIGTVGAIGVVGAGLAGIASQAGDFQANEATDPAISYSESADNQGLSSRLTNLEDQFQTLANQWEDSVAEIEAKTELVSQLAAETEQRHSAIATIQAELSSLHQGVQDVANEIGGLESLSNLYQEHQSVLQAITNFPQNAEYLQQMRDETAQSETRIDDRLHQTQQRINEINDLISTAQAELLQQAMSLSADTRRSPVSPSRTAAATAVSQSQPGSDEPQYNFEDEEQSTTSDRANVEIAFTPEPQANHATTTATGVSLEQLSTQLAGMAAQVRSEKDALQREMKQKLKNMSQTQDLYRTWLMGLSVGVVLALAVAIATFFLK